MLTSLQNERVKEWIKLQKSSKFRFEQKRYIVEGPKAVNEIRTELIEEIVIAEGYNGPLPEPHAGLKIEKVSDKVFMAISMEKTPQGIITVLKMEGTSLDTLVEVKAPLLVLLENVQDPGNVGTILRTADAAGASGVVLTKGSVDVYNPKVVQAAMGSLTRVPIVTKADIRETMEKLSAAGIAVYAGDLQADCWHFEGDYSAGTCFLMGNEGNGISDEARMMADRTIRIPMPGNAESLNVGIATGILLFEAVRQRMKSSN